MITVAVAARTMDRQARYRSLLPAPDYAILAALDCPTLARLARSRPVDVIIFDLQKPAMPAEDWLDLIESDPDVKCVPIVWVGRNILPRVFERALAVPGTLAVPERPDSRTLVEAVGRLADRSAKSRRKANVPAPPRKTQWQPEEDVIDQALAIFDEPSGEAGAAEEKVVSPEEIDSHVIKKVDPGVKAPMENSSISLETEEFGTGKIGSTLDPKSTKTPPGVVQEKFLSITTHPGFKKPSGPSQELVERITREVLTVLAARLVDELVAKIDPQLVRSLVEEKLSNTGADSPSPTI